MSIDVNRRGANYMFGSKGMFPREPVMRFDPNNIPWARLGGSTNTYAGQQNAQRIVDHLPQHVLDHFAHGRANVHAGFTDTIAQFDSDIRRQNMMGPGQRDLNAFAGRRGLSNQQKIKYGQATGTPMGSRNVGAVNYNAVAAYQQAPPAVQAQLAAQGLAPQISQGHWSQGTFQGKVPGQMGQMAHNPFGGQVAPGGGQPWQGGQGQPGTGQGMPGGDQVQGIINQLQQPNRNLIHQRNTNGEAELAQLRQRMASQGNMENYSHVAAQHLGYQEQARQNSLQQNELQRLSMALQAMGLQADIAQRLAQAQIMGQGPNGWV